VSENNMNQGTVVSLLGVTFTLLMCVMVSTPIMCGRMPVELPITKSPDIFGERGSDPIFHIKADGTRYFQHNWFPKGELAFYKDQIEQADRIILSADARLNFGVVRNALLDLSKYKRQGIVLESEKIWIEPEPTPFQEYLYGRSTCVCGW
jgi:biopolymer transport protein ExbD